MTGGARYVLLGLAPARSPWFRAVAQWATSASIPAEFVKCVSGDEVRARLASGRAHSALIVDAAAPSFDRDLVAAAVGAYTPVLAVVDPARTGWSAADLGVAAILDPSFSPSQLIEALSTHAQLIGRGDQLPPTLDALPDPMWRGRLVSVCGPGGTGASTVAIAVAQGMTADVRFREQVVLADLARRGDQAVLHEAPDLGPGLQELVEAHRLGRPDPDAIRRSCYHVPRRGYHLLLGLRHPSAWTALRPRAVDATLDGLRQTFLAVVADIDGDVEGEDACGSFDIEERNHLARRAATTADVVFVVGVPGLQGIHALGWQLRSLVGAGVDPTRIVPVVNRAPRPPRTRAELTRALATATGDLGSLSGPLFLPERKVDDLHRDGASLPPALVAPLDGARRFYFERLADAAPAEPEPVAVRPGALGRWVEEPDVS